MSTSGLDRPGQPRAQSEPRGPSGRRRPALVVGHDRHRAARAALTVAIALARDLDAELHVVHSATLDDCGIDPDLAEIDTARARNLADERAEITELLRDSGLVWAYHEQEGNPAHALAALADEVDAAYLVVGATHPGTLHHLIKGESVAQQLLKHQHRPVLVVPEPAAATVH